MGEQIRKAWEQDFLKIPNFATDMELDMSNLVSCLTVLTM